MIIVVEGMDGVGKTTISKLLAERNNFKYIDKPLHSLFEIDTKDKKKLEDFEILEEKIFDTENDIIKAWLTGLGNLYCFIKNKNENIIVDRHIVSNYIWNGTKETKKIFDLLNEYMPKPNMTIILYACSEVRMERIHNRNENDKDLSDLSIRKDQYKKMTSFLKYYDIPYIGINTEDKSIKEIVEEIEVKVNFKSNRRNNYGNIKPSREH